MTRDQLQARSKKDLADMARRKGIAGWHAMRKEDLFLAKGVLSAYNPNLALRIKDYALSYPPRVSLLD